jgi:hypothetical protein
MAVQGGNQLDCPDCSEEEDEEDATAVADSGAASSDVAGQQQQQQQKGKGKSGRKSGGGGGGGKRKGRSGGGSGGICQLLCFCPRHRGTVPPGPKLAPIHASNTGAAMPTPTRVAAAAAAAVGALGGGGPPLPFGLPGGALRAGGAHPQAGPAAKEAVVGGAAAQQQAQQQPLLSPGRAIAAAAAAASAPPGTCARSRAADAALRRGLRAPEALEAALRKRLYVRRLPYLVTGRPPRPGRPLLPPPSRGARTCGLEFEADGKGPDWVGGAAAGGASARCHAPVLSQAERFARMVATTADRVAMGKSAIHGWGAFAKVPHRAGALGCAGWGGLGRAGAGWGGLGRARSSSGARPEDPWKSESAGFEPDLNPGAEGGSAASEGCKGEAPAAPRHVSWARAQSNTCPPHHPLTPTSTQQNSTQPGATPPSGPQPPLPSPQVT